uniref:CYTH domain-containing protein n=1 Tax=Cellulosimicrobium cellulans TaxID=1710 RepID=UPI000AD172F1
MTYRERERTLSAPDGWELPALELDGLVAEPDEPLRLDALYYDTPDLRLLARGVTLRRRTGGEDAGWHLKLPAPGDARDELRRPLGADAGPLPTVLADPATAPAPPDELATLVVGLARGKALAPVGRIRTERRTTVLRDARDGGAPLVEIAQDAVTTERIAPGAGPQPTNADPHAGRATDAWREIEVELTPAGLGTDDPEALLAAVVDALVDAGATAGPSAPKLARALGVGAD